MRRSRGQTNISGSRWPGGNRNDEILETFGSFPSLCPLLHFKHQYINFSLYDEILDAFGSFPNLCSLLDLKQQFKADMFNQFPIYLQWFKSPSNSKNQLICWTIHNSWTKSLLEDRKISTESFWQGLPSDDKSF